MSRSFATPEAVESAFYQAFQELDPALMDQVWDRNPDVFCVHPGGGLQQGRAAVLESWAAIFHKASRPSVLFRTLQVTGHGDLAVHLVEEVIRPSADPQKEPSRVLSTNVYRRSRGGWHLLSHHASLPLMSAPHAPHPGQLH